MRIEEIKAALDGVASNLKLFDTIIEQDYTTGEGRITATQVELVQNLIDLFRAMRWGVSLEVHKQVEVGEQSAIRKPLGHKQGALVSVRSCRKEHGDKTYLGILIGDVATGIHTAVNGETLKVGMSHYNPAILIPGLGEIVYGCESWWGVIESEDDLKEVITDETIQSVWYVKALLGMCGKS